MWDTSARLLRLLSLLQQPRDWTAEQLGAELAVTVRTVRRDVARLRDLGYPVDSTHGVGGGYRLAAGASLPPLLFDLDEAVAVLDAMTAAAAASDEPLQDPLASALTKLEAAMPGRLRPAVQSLLSHTTRLELGEMIGAAPLAVEASTLVVLAQACRQRRRLTARPVTGQHAVPVTEAAEVTLEPLRLVQTMGRWYVVAYSLTARDWQVLRVDRLDALRLIDQPATHQWPVAQDPQAYVADHVRSRIQTVTGTVRVHAPAKSITGWILPAWGRVIEETPISCIVECGADSYDGIACWLVLLNADLTVLAPDALREAFGRLAERAGRAASADPEVVAHYRTRSVR